MDRLFPGEKVWRLSFEPDQSLFQLDDGSRVVADAVGPGLYSVHEFQGTIWVDGSVSSINVGSFERSFRALANPETLSKIELHLGRTTPINPVFWKVPDHVKEFAGWMLAPEGWTFLEPVYTYESLDQDRPVGAPGIHQCLTAESFFLRNDEDRERVRWQSSDELKFETVEDFPAPFFSQTNQVTFQVEVPEENEGVQIARFLDASVGQQRVTVTVNEKPAGDWYYPFQNSSQPIQADVFGIPIELTRRCEMLMISLTVPPGSPPWCTAWYGVDVLLPRLQ